MNNISQKNKNLKSSTAILVIRINSHYRRMNMPVYEFECTKGHITEKLVPMGTKNTRCTKCKKIAKKILSTCTFELKGGGWYADGYSSTNSKGSKKSV
jgi:putative FmdB family regulatory protein